MRKVKVKKKSEYGIKIPLKFSLDTLNIILAYVISESDMITRGNLVNTRKLFKMIDLKVYREHQLECRVRFIKRALDLKLNSYIENPKLLLEAAKTTKYEDVDDEIIDDMKNMSLKPSEIKFVTKMVSEKLTYSYFYKYKDSISNLIGRIDNGEYENFKDLSVVLKKELVSLLSEIRRTEQLESNGEMFSLAEDLFETVVTKTVKKLQAPANQLKTMIQCFNETLNGGFENGRTYLFLGLSGRVTATQLF